MQEEERRAEEVASCDKGVKEPVCQLGDRERGCFCSLTRWAFFCFTELFGYAKHAPALENVAA